MIVVSSRSRQMMARKPSHFGSYSQSSPLGISAVNLASSGAGGGWKGSAMTTSSTSCASSKLARMPLTNRELAELLALESDKHEGNKQKAARRSARIAL